ncbi:MAG TPA: ribonuclease J [Candidatus Saccharimonadia bacterium]|nr:ribonuclease J [Candidatus Saccharimonadia bacterium]
MQPNDNNSTNQSNPAPQGDQPSRPPRQNRGSRGGQRGPRDGQNGNGGQAKAGAPTGNGAPAKAPQSKGRGGGGGGGGRGRRRGQQQVPNHTDLVPALDAMPVNKSIYNGLSGTQQSKKGAGPDRGPANQVNREPKLRVIPLGGLGEVGKNMMAIEYGNDIITVDMGFMFPTPTKQPGVDYMIPDVSYLVKNKHKIRGHLLTHAHEDHMGGIPFILPQLPAPIYTARFSAGMVEKKLVEYHLQTQPQLRVMDPDKHERVQLGAFNVEFVRVTHTIPDACAVVITTPAGKIINTGDWRFDPTPVDGKNMDMARLEELGREGVLLLMSDSTSCEFLGRTQSESEIAASFDDLFNRATGRIILASFSSQINRIQLVIDATARRGRKIAFVGRSMLANVELAVKLGYIKIPAGLVMRVQDIVNQPDDQIVIMCTGSQGEENSALTRMGTGDHQNVKIKPGDSVVMSSSIIPGNERSVVGSIDALMREGARVYHHVFRDLDHVGVLHVGGHARRDEVVELVRIVKPKYFMPIHGEFHMLVRNAEAAIEAGVPQDHVFVMDNGDVLELTPDKAVKGARVPAGVVMIDGAGIGDVEGVVLRDRLAMAGDGVFMIIATVSRKTGRLISSPDIISRGFIYMKENEELINKARAEVRKAFEKRAASEHMSREDWAKFKLKLRDEVGDVLYSKTKRSPMILPVINEV